MGEPFLGEIKIISWNFPPKGWAFCNGQQMPINQNQALFSILGTTYGGNGQTTFALPDLRGRIPFHFGDGFILGQAGGEQAHTLTQSEMPAHIHVATGSAVAGAVVSPAGAYYGTSTQNPYSPTPNGAMGPQTITNTGGSQAHLNMPPFLVLNFIIALIGIFPSRN